MPKNKIEKPGYSWAVPEELDIPPDPLRLRLDFHHQAVEMTYFEGDTITNKVVSALDVAHALASELSFSSGLLPAGALWWRNTRSGAVIALYVEPQVRVLSLQESMNKPPHRFKIPLPGLIFICRQGTPPWVYAVKKKPTRETDIVYKSPLANIHANGRSCPGSHTYPARIEDVPQSFFISFFSATADLQNRSQKFPKNVISLWNFLDGKRRFPVEDLVKHGIVADLLGMEMD